MKKITLIFNIIVLLDSVNNLLSGMYQDYMEGLSSNSGIIYFHRYSKLNASLYFQKRLI